MITHTVKFTALAALTCVALLIFPFHTVNAQQPTRTEWGKIHFVQTESGLTLTWPEIPDTMEYIIDVFDEIAWREKRWDDTDLMCGSSYETTFTIPASVYEGKTLIKVEVFSQDSQAPVALYYAGIWNVAGGGNGIGSYQESFLLGAIGKAYRVSDDQIDLYEIIEGTTQGVLAFRITQEEIDAALEAAGEATCVKASRNDRASVTVWADGNVTFSIGPDYETKIFHVLLEGGLGGPIIGHSTTYGPPAGAHCPN